MFNPLKKKNTYLRRKTELLKDYLTVGIGLSIFGIFVYRKYKQINPPDPYEEPSYSKEYGILDFVQDQIRKYSTYKALQYQQYKEQKEELEKKKKEEEQQKQS